MLELRRLRLLRELDERGTVAAVADALQFTPSAVSQQLAMLERARGRVGAAFEVSERIRASEMLELLGQGRVAATQDTAAELVSSEQDLRRHIAGVEHCGCKSLTVIVGQERTCGASRLN